MYRFRNSTDKGVYYVYMKEMNGDNSAKHNSTRAVVTCNGYKRLYHKFEAGPISQKNFYIGWGQD